jgi:hypothetical protein
VVSLNCKVTYTLTGEIDMQLGGNINSIKDEVDNKMIKIAAKILVDGIYGMPIISDKAIEIAKIEDEDGNVLWESYKSQVCPHLPAPKFEKMTKEEEEEFYRIISDSDAE